MKLKNLKVLLPALTGMILTSGAISPVSDNKVQMNKSISLGQRRKMKQYTKDDVPFEVYYKDGEEIENVYYRFLPIGDYLPYLYEYSEEKGCYEIKSDMPLSEYENNNIYLNFLNNPEYRTDAKIYYAKKIDLNLDTVKATLVRDYEEKRNPGTNNEEIARYVEYKFSIGGEPSNNIYDPNFYLGLDVEKVFSFNYYEKSTYDNYVSFDFSSTKLEKCFEQYKAYVNEKTNSFPHYRLYCESPVCKTFNLSELPYSFRHNSNEEEYANPKLEVKDNYTFIGLLQTENVTRSYFIEKDMDVRQFIKNRFINGSRMVGDITEAILFKSSENELIPYNMVLKFTEIDSVADESYERTLFFNNVYLKSHLSFKNNDKEIKEEDEINFGYGKSVNDVLSLISYPSTLNESLTNKEILLYCEIDGQKFTLDPANIDNRKLLDIFNNKNGKSLVEFYIVNNKDEIYNEEYKNKLISFYINWADDIAPEITGEVTKYRTSKKDNFKYKELFKANDEKDGDVSESIELIEEEGKYFIKAKDASGNERKKEILLDIDPILYEHINVINDEKIQIPENILLSKSRFEKILKKIYEVDPQDVDVITYVNNCKTKGTYKVSFKINDERKEMDFEVVDPIKKTVEPGDAVEQLDNAKNSFVEFWKNLWGKIKVFFIKLGNWFRGVFTKWKWDCFITNEQWDTRFN